MKETIAKINKTKSCFFEKISKTYKPLARIIKKKREKNQNNKIKNKNGEITTEKYKRSQETIMSNYINKIDNLEEMDKFLETYITFQN